MTHKRIINTLIALIITAMTAASIPARPDFAFPEKVSDTARRDLDRALADGNDAAALRAALNLTRPTQSTPTGCRSRSPFSTR